MVDAIGMGEIAQPADLVDENLHFVERAGQTLDVTVSGLEDCAAANHGGFCSTLAPQ